MLVRPIAALPPLLLPLLLAAPGAAGELESLSRSQMKPGQLWEFRTTGRTYRAKVVDVKTGECLVSASTDGLHFGATRKTFLLGATRGDQGGGLMLVLMAQIKVGLGIELAVDDLAKKHRYVTPDVTEIRLLTPDDAAGHAA